MNYHAAPGNYPCPDVFRAQVARMWLDLLRRRSRRGRRRGTCARMAGLTARWLPRARIRHPYPNPRLIVTT